ncbi:nucleotide disphospho-sugar-binding domain-containing protein [Nocardiopsis ansamitocini]|uniref:Glycosyl transferase n=1 Tax=Nocardiopsis ansamitocini TaxID=1670832 RepID=A0A9W6P9F1_9ACTN|nr:nucleotide disphospho-sugar-binding domain-containing protein [Nocardiopsis ansamitocini]GLU50039.1 glycosyl transferase [Nocardiopsis ansamitocini]
MRILIATYADRSYFFSMVPLAWALRAAGHEVRVASQPELTDAAASTGLTVLPVGEDHMSRKLLHSPATQQYQDYQESAFNLAEDRPEELTWDRLKKAQLRFVVWWWKVINEPMLKELVAFCREWRPDLVIWEPMTFAGAVAAEACGAAHARFLWSYDLVGQNRRNYLEAMAEQPAHEHADPLREWLTSRAERYDVPFSEDLIRGQFSIGPIPASLRAGEPVVEEKVGVRHVPYEGATVLPGWLRTPLEQRRVLVDWRALRAGDPERSEAVLREVLAGAIGLDAEVLLVLPPADRETLPPFPDRVRVIEEGISHIVLPTCSAVVHPGGFDTYCTSLLHGVPQVIVPEPDLFDATPLASALADASAGSVLPWAGCTAGGVRERLDEVLGSAEIAAGVRRLQQEVLAMPTPDLLVAELERLTVKHRKED